MEITIVGCGISGVSAAVLVEKAGHAAETFETRGDVEAANMTGMIGTMEE